MMENEMAKLEKTLKSQNVLAKKIHH